MASTATGDAAYPIAYQWYSGTAPDSTQPVSGRTGNSLTVSPASTASYWVQATNPCGAANSNTAVVTVCTKPAIAGQPNSKTITRGQTATLRVWANGSAPLSYQWYTADGTLIPIAGATGESISVTPAATTKYRVKVVSSCGEAVSQIATVTVQSPPTVPSGVLVTAAGPGAMAVSWSPSSAGAGISGYRLRRLPDGYSFDVTTGTSTTDTYGLVPGRAYVYTVRAVDQNGVESGSSAPELATLLSFDPEAFQSNKRIRGSDIGQLRRAVDAVRATAGLSPAWTSYEALTGIAYAASIIEIQTRLNEARTTLYLPPVQPSIPVAKDSYMLASQVRDIQAGVQ